MAYTYSVNNLPATSGYTIYLLISTLMAAGWTKPMDSDGTTYSSSGIQVTGGNTSVNGLNNSRAWVRLRAPAVSGQNREITIQRGTTSDVWRIKYSAVAGFTGGSPAATVTPSATDEVFMLGGGTDASPTFFGWFNPDGTYQWHVVAGGLAESYSFVAWGKQIATLTAFNGIFLDVMTAGSYPSTDLDPAVMYCSSGSLAISEIANTVPIGNVTNSAKARAWMGPFSTAGASLTSNNVNVGIAAYSGSIGAGTNFGTNPWTNKEDLLPCLWLNQNTTFPRGIKGYSTLFKMGTINRSNMTTADILGTKDKIFFGNLWLPWSGVTPLI